MKCEKASEITDFLKGETPERERETLRVHFEACAHCAGELARFDRVLKALGKLESVDPTPGFKWRVREAFLRAHPEFLEAPRREVLSFWDSLRMAFGYVPAWAMSVAAHVILIAVAAILFFSPPSPEEIQRDLAVRAQPHRRVAPKGPEFGRPAPAGGEIRPAEAPGPVDDLPSEEYARGPETPGGSPVIRVPRRVVDPEKDKRDARVWRDRIPRDRRLLAFFEARGREPMQGETRAAFGGEGTEPAIRAALAWLARAQQADGRWTGPSTRQEGGVQAPYATGLTGLALMAFLAEGHSGKSGEFAPAVRRGLDYLLQEQKASGLIGPDTGNYLYNHAIASLALLEAALMTRDEALSTAAAAAVSYTVRAQNDDGGWGYSSRSVDSDTSVGGWQILLLRLAKLGGNQGVIPSLVQAHQQLQLVTDSDGRAGYRGRLQFPNGYHALTAVGMFAHQMATHTPDPALLEKQAAILRERPPLPGREPSEFPANDLYFAFFGSLALHQYGGEAWTAWWGPLRQSLLAGQQPDGSWPANFDRWHAYGGQVYTTALSTLILETPVRYPRLAD
ncbi:MAG TPA: hypothetical protein VEJ18_20730 [Planctomycetota bacterium]|nr:hypothetical protein [Planctomycetota bacterium]